MRFGAGFHWKKLNWDVKYLLTKLPVINNRELLLEKSTRKINQS